MIILGVVRDPTQEQRFRSITGWSIHDWGDGHYSVIGWVVTGNEEGDGVNARHTKTSPIRGRIGSDVVMTESGSLYTLLEPNAGQDPDQLLELFVEIPES